MASVIGWDIGGAHLKAARIEAGRVVAVLQLPCPLWLGLDRLDAALAEAVQRLGPASLHAATMSGELADVFADRTQGVIGITEALRAAIAPAPLCLYAGAAGFLPPALAAARAGEIASANWHASAALAARDVRDALFVDIGSTTTDLIPIVDGVVRAGASDAARLAAGELVYTGLTRSFVMALAARAPFGGVWQPLAREYFASSADVYRILGTLPADADLLDTADGREKTVAASIARLARMVGRDAATADEAAWRDLAAFFAEAQLRDIADAAMQCLSRVRLPPEAPVIGAGIGMAVVEALAARLGRPYRALTEPASHALHAPAVAVGLLAV